MSFIETAARYSAGFEVILEDRFGAYGFGLHEKLTSVETRPPRTLIREIRKIATLSSKALHERFEIPNLVPFAELCEDVKAQLYER